jgi:hypothetical protein
LLLLCISLILHLMHCIMLSIVTYALVLSNYHHTHTLGLDRTELESEIQGGKSVRC